jgi:hypothetical protein
LKSQFENCVDQFSENLLKNDLSGNLELFLLDFPRIFTNFLRVHEDRCFLVNSPLSNNFLTEKIAHLDESAMMILSSNTKPLIYIATAGDINSLKTIDSFSCEPDYKIRLSNGYNLLHCLIGNQNLSIEQIRPCIDFLLEKNIHMLTEVDHFGITPLQLCNNALSNCYNQYFEIDQTIQQFKTQSKDINHKNKRYIDHKIYLSNQEVLKKNIGERIYILIETIRTLQSKIINLPQKKTIKNRESLQDIVKEHVRNEPRNPQGAFFKYREVNCLSKSSPGNL